jgi:hypothetical protein
MGLPVYYDAAAYTDKKDLYRNVFDRVNPADPENSLLLRKPISLQHGGGLQLQQTDQFYNMLLNWIRNGALCGTDPMYCN